MAKQQRELRPAGFDDLGLRRVLGDRVLPLLVASMTFLAALAFAGSVAAAALARHWAEGAASAITVQVPQAPQSQAAPARAARSQSARPQDDAEEQNQARVDRVLAILRAMPGISEIRAISKDELLTLLKPWLGNDAGRLSLALPAVIELRMTPSWRAAEAELPGAPEAAKSGAPEDADPAARAPDNLAELGQRLQTAVPGTMVERHGDWVERLTGIARSLQALASLILLLVALVAAAVIAVATRTGLLARRETIELVHGLGATDGYIAGRFASRATRLAGLGGLAGAIMALPVLIAMSAIARPLVATEAAVTTDGLSFLPFDLPLSVWLATAALPLAAAAIGFATAHATVRGWLRRLP